MNNYQPRLACVARCKNEIHIIKRWIESLPFVDLFCITDNNSTDGTYEYLKSLPNVLVTQVEGFDEGRDFQILLGMARTHKPEWILKIDCDEIFEDLGIQNFEKLLEQKKYDAIFFRRLAFDYRLGESKYVLGRANATEHPLLCLARNSRTLNILNLKSHVGPFVFYRHPALSNFRLKHFTIPSYQKAIEKQETYNKMKGKGDHRDYNYEAALRQEINPERIHDFEEPEENYLIKLDCYGMPCLELSGKTWTTIRPQKGKKYLKVRLKELTVMGISLFRLNKLFLFALQKILNKKR